MSVVDATKGMRTARLTTYVICVGHRSDLMYEGSHTCACVSILSALIFTLTAIRCLMWRLVTMT
ncbi:unnamed protein product [Taenia asiatica]|uniref:Uncharacterized protein n=1 Tax=Taenia asiatica TaxID=60517 RepID=A0A3P6R1A1_TAEAS|nr:unnamed protein product [Taenia asiatica]